MATEGWRWSQWVPLMLAAVVYAFGSQMPETYPREILRRKARNAGIAHDLPKALSGESFAEMAKVTVVTPVVMLFTDPITAFSTLYVSFLFGTVFQWFISVPAVLETVYKFSVQQAGLAFTSAIGGVVLAVVTSVLLERFAYPREVKKTGHRDMVDIEYRVLPAMLGAVFVAASFFWIGWTAKPDVRWASPVLGTGLNVWGNMMVLVSVLLQFLQFCTPPAPIADFSKISTISYLFDAFPPAGTLSSLTIAACMRLLVAAAIPLVIIQDITKLGGGWVYSIFGIIGGVLMILPYIGYKWGSDARAESKYNNVQMMGMEDKSAEREESRSSDAEMMEGARV